MSTMPQKRPITDSGHHHCGARRAHHCAGTYPQFAVDPKAAAILPFDGLNGSGRLSIIQSERIRSMQYTASIPVFVISLRGSSRFNFLHQRLIALDIPFEKVDAIDGSELEGKWLADVYDERRALTRIGRPLSRGEIGNALSHRKVWQMILDRNLASALVLEEDAIIDLPFRSFLRIAHAIPDEVGFPSLYTQAGYVFRRPTTRLGEFKLHAAALGLTRTVGYVIRAKYAQGPLALGSRIETPTDWPYNHSIAAQYLALPMPVSHADYGSVIEPERTKLINQYIISKDTCPKWVPGWLRKLAYITCLAYLLRPDRYHGFANYLWREVVWRLRLAIFAPLGIARLR